MPDAKQGSEKAGSGRKVRNGPAVTRGRIKEQSSTALKMAEKRGRLKQPARARRPQDKKVTDAQPPDFREE